MSPKTLIIWMLVFIVSVVGIAFLLTAGQTPAPATATFSTQDTDKPKAETSNTSRNLGEIKVSDVKVEDYALKNVGTKPLQILNVNSSCGCTAGQIIYQGKTSKEFSMHTQSGFVTEIAPGDTATIRLTYRPASMPVYGLVEREVYVETNDPANSKLIFSITAKVK
jgi:hypothetical protein